MSTPFFTKHTNQFRPRQSIDHTFRRVLLVSLMCTCHVSLKSTPWEGLGFNIFPQKRVWKSLSSSYIQSGGSFCHSATTLYVHALFKHTHCILHAGLLWVLPCSSANLHEGHSRDAAGVWVFFQPHSQTSLWLTEALM
jgi:hypothetical protein